MSAPSTGKNRMTSSHQSGRPVRSAWTATPTCASRITRLAISNSPLPLVTSVRKDQRPASFPDAGPLVFYVMRRSLDSRRALRPAKRPAPLWDAGLSLDEWAIERLDLEVHVAHAAHAA